MGNIGIQYENKLNSISFKFYILEAYDVMDKRYYKSEMLFENKYLNYFIDNLDYFFLEALSIYKTWQKEDLIEVRTIKNLE